MKRSVFVVLIQLGLLALILPSFASAKNVRSVTICGASGCHEVMGLDRDVLAPLVEGGSPGPPPSHGAPWYRVRATVGGEGGHAKVSLAIVPRLGLLRGCCSPTGEFNWISLTGEGERAYARLTRALHPLPASSLRGVAGPPAAKPPASAPTADPPSQRSGAGAPSWPWILIGASALGLGLGIERRRRRS